MTLARRLLALTGLALSATPAPAQPGPYAVGYVRVGRHGLLSLSLGGYAAPTYSYFGATYNYVSPFVVVSPPVQQVNVFYPPQVVAPTRGVVLDDLALDVLPREFLEARGARLPPREQVAQQPPPEMPGRDAGIFRPLDPGNRDRAAKPLPAQPDARLPELPRQPLPEDDPEAEYKRLVGLGKEAFTAAEYGRAADRFRQATRARPKNGEAHFLLTQALIARGKYVAAYDAAVAGLAVKPDWPTSGFKPLDLYGANAADYADHMRRLDVAAGAGPADPALAFVHAYALWFDGRRDEARKAFARARDLGADKDAVDRFLRAAVVAAGL
jgi:tetratricopeptide (TPR) repeat protein